MRHVLSALCLALVAGVAAAEDDPAALDRSLASSFGGLNEEDEHPAFGDADLLAAEFQAVDPKVKDPMTRGGQLRDARHVRIAVLWGYLRPHPDATDSIDWGGEITAGNAALRVIRTLGFEETDVVVRPRTDVNTVAFESKTRTHADGLLIDVVLAPALNPDGASVTLTFRTPPSTQTIPIEPDMCRSRIVDVDDAGHVVAYHVIRPDADGCTDGFLEGIWRTKTTASGRELGVIKGRFTDDEGRLRGHLRGVFGMRENGKQVWFAKVIDKDGGFLGLLVGRYGDGRFAGLLLGKGREVRGVVHGRYLDGDREDDGAFLGRFERCRKDPRKGETIDGDEPDVSIDDDDC